MCIDLGGSFFQRPPPDVLANIILDPGSIKERGWIIIFNCIVSTAVSLQKDSSDVLKEGLRWNTKHAMDDATIFLQPSIVKIQAFLLLATHSYDYSTPSLSWQLIGHACQMLQGLGLHNPSSMLQRTPADVEYFRALFWSVSQLDNSLSLAFGRPPFLSKATSRNVPFPKLPNYNPHLGPLSPSNDPASSTLQIPFGTSYFRANFELCVIITKVYHTLNSDTEEDRNSVKAQQVSRLVSELDEWREITQKVCFSCLLEHHILNWSPLKQKLSLCIEQSEATEDAMKSTSFALKYLDFRYYHLLTFLTRNYISANSSCLSSARNSLSLLGTLVSNAEHVYNGVVWLVLS
jgi:hypothetical protein